LSSTILAQATDEKNRLEQQFLHKTGGNESIATLRSEMQSTMEDSVGIYRTGASLQEAQSKLQKLKDRFHQVAIQDHSHTFNTELTAALELAFMLDVSEAVVAAALNRTESRGAHQRIDFPQRDDTKFLAHSLVSYRKNDRPRVAYSPVTITRWPPGERVYGR